MYSAWLAGWDRYIGFFTLKCIKDAHQLRRHMVSFMSLDIFQTQP